MPTTFRRATCALAMAVLGPGLAVDARGAELVGRAVLPAQTFADGPTSGQYIRGAAGGIVPPFVDKQPVQGFSAVADLGDGSFLVMSDNGFGSLQTSADYNLRVYRIRPDFETARGGSGRIDVTSFIELSDPFERVRFPIVHHFSRQRVLTGADFDIESMQRAPDGTLWFGDEFGPFLLHTDARGVVLEPPIPLPDFDRSDAVVRAPQYPGNEETAALRVMNAVRAQALSNGATRAPVFSPYHVELAFPGADPNAHYARGTNSPADLLTANSNIHDIAQIRAAGFPVVPYTVNDKPAMLRLMAQKVDGLISDRPDVLLEAVREFDADANGLPGDYLDADGLPDGTKFSAQGHRGGRDLRPENTLPAFEAALDFAMTTLETDSGLTADLVPVLSHDPYVQSDQCRRRDGQAYGADDEVLIRTLTVQQIQSRFVCDKTFRGPSQVNDPALSPVARAFAAQAGLPNLYTMPTVQQLYDFVAYYRSWYANGAGRASPAARARSLAASRVRFNIETKINPRSDRDRLGNVYRERTWGPVAFADQLTRVIKRNQMAARTDVQSFDFRPLLWVQERHPDIRAVYLFGDFPIYDGVDSDDGTNLQPEPGRRNTPWMAGLHWPYRSTVALNPFRAAGSGGFEGMALSKDADMLYPLLERPLAGSDPTRLQIAEFAMKHRRYTGRRWFYPLDARGTNIGDFVLFSRLGDGLVIERDGSQGMTAGYKAISQIRLCEPGTNVAKELLVDLQNIADPRRISLPAHSGDVGLGDPFSFPFTTIEDIVILGPRRVGVLNDNNFPFSIGRHVGSGAPDDNEFIVLELDRPLRSGH